MSVIKLKICGVKSAAEARQLKNLDLDYIGLNFVPSSSRCISFDTAASILEELKDSGVQSVALFSGQSLRQVCDYAHRLKVDYVQLHGNESADYAKMVDTPVIRAVSISPDSKATEIIDFISQFPADYFVLDRHRQGTGSPIDLNLANQIIQAHPSKIFLAGGLTSDNLADVLNKTHPYGIDIAFGIRTNQNTLDLAKVTTCLQTIHKAS